MDVFVEYLNGADRRRRRKRRYGTTDEQFTGGMWITIGLLANYLIQRTVSILINTHTNKQANKQTNKMETQRVQLLIRDLNLQYNKTQQNVLLLFQDIFLQDFPKSPNEQF